MMGREFWLPIFMGILLTPLCFLLGAFFSGGGHSMWAMIVFYPYATLLGLLTEKVSWLIALPMMVLQFPIYGAAFGAANVKDQFQPLAVSLAVAHFLAVIVGLVVNYALNG